MSKELKALKRIFERIDYFTDYRNPFLRDEQKLCGKLAKELLIDDDMRELVGKLKEESEEVEE